MTANVHRMFFSALLCVTIHSFVLAADPNDAQYVGLIVNETIWHDTQGNEIWSNGGNMLQVADTFYWIGYETAPRRPWKINLYSSKNLADWKFEAAPIQRTSDYRHLGWAGRPSLLYCENTRKWLILSEAASRRWTRHKVAYSVSDNLTGPYHLLNCAYPEPNQPTGDQSVYIEGRDAYLLAALDGEMVDGNELNSSLAIYKLTDDYTAVAEKLYEGWRTEKRKLEEWPDSNTAPGCEAPHIVKHADRYYIFTSRLWGWHSSPTMYSAAKSLEGPWSELKILPTVWEGWVRPTLSFNTQHDFIIPIRGAHTTTYLYVGNRYSQWHNYGTGRNIFLPLIFNDHTEPQLLWRQKWQINTKTGERQNIGEIRL